MNLAANIIEQIQIEAAAAAAYFAQVDGLRPTNAIAIKRLAQDALRTIQRDAERAIQAIDRELEDMRDVI